MERGTRWLRSVGLGALALGLPCVAMSTLAQSAQAVPVTLEQIMSDPDWLGNPPENPYWADDGQSIFFSQKRPGEDQRDLVQIDLGGQVLRTVGVGEAGGVDASGGDLSLDGRWKVYTREGDVFLKNLETGARRQLTRTVARENNARFLADGKRIAFVRDQTVFVRDLESGLEAQLVELKLSKDPDDKDEPFDYLREQQTRLLATIRRGEEKSDAAKERELAERRADPTRVPPPVYLGDGKTLRQLSLSPSGEWLLVLLEPKDSAAEEGKPSAMPNYVTASGYVESREVRAKVGTGAFAGHELVLVDLVHGQKWPLSTADLPGIADDPLKELREKAEAARKAKKEGVASDLEQEDFEPADVIVATPPEAGTDAAVEATAEVIAEPETPAPAEQAAAPAEPAKAKPRAVRFESLVWTRDGRRIAVQAFSVDNKDRWTALVDLAAHALVPVHRATDEAWVDWDQNEIGWLPDGESLFYLSEESGFSQLYLAPVGEGMGAPHHRLTQGEFVVSDVVASRDGAFLYFRANVEHPGVYEVFRIVRASGELQKITTLGGLNSFVLSPDERSLLITHSGVVEPPELYLQRAEPGATAARLTRTVSEAFRAIEWTRPEVVAVPSAQAPRPIYSRLYKPASPPDDGLPGPAVIFIHGAGYLQNAHFGWSGYFREFMFHTVLTQRGYTVLDMDYRASAGYGRDWRTAIYRQMGTPELEDLEDGVRFLVENHGVDRQRIGVYGGSYGGFLTMMALFKRPELFQSGAALRPVTDWAHYNHPYTSAILNTPTVDPEAYERSSPIEFADGLAKPLLICAPMQDDNVFFQDVVRLAQKLIELKKEDWEVAIYPVEGHGFVEPTSWLDEYRRIFKLFERTLR